MLNLALAMIGDFGAEGGDGLATLIYPWGKWDIASTSSR